MPKRWSVHVVVGLWMLTGFILGTTYRSNLKAMLISPRIVIPFNTIQELVNSKITLFVPDSNSLHQAMMASSPDSPLGKLRPQSVFHQDYIQAIKDLFAGSIAASSPSLVTTNLEHTYFSQTGRCQLYIMSENLLQMPPLGIGFPKGSPLKPKFDIAISGLKEFGILSHILHKWTSNSTECTKPITQKGTPALRSLDLGDFYGIFSLYAGVDEADQLSNL
ncbi:Glutamate receptor ionotropic, kainate 2-like 10, partial [Homarus americanus]